FKASFSGTQNIWGYVEDQAGVKSGWQSIGSWQTTAGSGPTVVRVTPNSGSGSSQTFSFQYSSGNGFNNIARTYELMNSTLSYANSCSTWYERGTNSIYLNQDG